MTRNQTIMKRAEWLKYCLDIGYPKEALPGLEKIWDTFKDGNGQLKTSDQFIEQQFCTCNPEHKTGSTSAMHCNHCGKAEPSETWLQPSGWGWGKPIEMPTKPS